MLDSTHQENNTKIRSMPAIGEAKGLKQALLELAPMLKKAQSALNKLPLRPVIDVLTSDEIMVRFATAEELQRIIMKSFLGRVVVNTLPIKLGLDPAVTAQIAILTSEGYVVLPGSFASQKVGEGAIELGNKQLLSAETRAIRRSLRELGLRAEYEEYDVVQKKDEIDNSEEDESDKANEISDIEFLGDFEDMDEESDIPSIPKDKIKSANEGKSEKKSGKNTKVKEKAAVNSKKAQAAKKKPHVIPKNPLSLMVDREHENWPSIKSIRYQNDLLDVLGKIRTKSGMTVDVMVRRVFGKNHDASKRLATYTTNELEVLYQFYAIQQEKV